MCFIFNINPCFDIYSPLYHAKPNISHHQKFTEKYQLLMKGLCDISSHGLNGD